jgi:phage terminase small subunit
VARPDGLTDREWHFVEAYCADPEHNGTAAYKAAGYRAKTDASAAAAASRLLKRVRVAQAVLDNEDAFRRKVARKYATTKETLIQRCLQIANLDIADLFDESGNLLDVHGMEEEVRRSLAGIETVETVEKAGEEAIPLRVRKLKLADRVAAIRLAAQLLGELTEKREVTGKGGGPIELTEVEKKRKHLAGLVAEELADDSDDDQGGQAGGDCDTGAGPVPGSGGGAEEGAEGEE